MIFRLVRKHRSIRKPRIVRIFGVYFAIRIVLEMELCTSPHNSPQGYALATVPEATASEEASVCRICLETVSYQNQESGISVKLGCLCSASGGDLMHRECASQWFGNTRCSTTCEVCSEEAVGLPLDIQSQIRCEQAGYAQNTHSGIKTKPTA